MPVVASGGAGNAEHMADVLLEGKADAALAASIFHFGTLRISDVKAQPAERGLPMRPDRAALSRTPRERDRRRDSPIGPTFDAQELIPAIVQDATSGQVLMLGYMNREAYERTLAEGQVWFWSRSRRRLWMKGESSGNV